MSPEPADQRVLVLGDGCAALSLAMRAGDLARHSLTLVRPQGAPTPVDHIWGFWDGPDMPPAMAAARGLARASWDRWAIITADGGVVMQSAERRYFALHRQDWTRHCEAAARQAGVGFAAEADHNDAPAAAILDSRPPPVPDGMMLQHFIGLEVRSGRPVFDAGTAILMDFRVDQSRGMHFIYLLPFSATEALVESTLFTPERLDEGFYLDAIKGYLGAHYGLHDYEILRRERGVIPLGRLSRHDPDIAGIGGNGGAIRPSSGYAFVFIQKQIDRAVAEAGEGGALRFRTPHKPVDLWMDAVLLSVLRHWPERAPALFLRMGRALNGDEFARFLSGEAGWSLRLKVIMAMPKWPFLRGLMKLMAGGSPYRATGAL
ncbi:MAG: lycopene cyclase family protein [Candidatus Puniceispirillaceae bacterium]